MSYGVRTLARQPGFAMAAGLSLALGIGVTTAIFSVLNAVALRPLPYTDANRLFWMTQVLRKNSTDEVTITAHFLEWRRQNHTFTDLAGYNYQTRNLTGLEEPLQLRTAKASASLLPLLGVQPTIGRNFREEEDYKGRDQVALLANDLWQQQFGNKPNILGHAIMLDGVPFTVVGVLPRDFVFPGPDPVQLITPLGKDEAAELAYKGWMTIVFNVVGRLKPDVTPQQARSELAVIQSSLPVPAFRPTIDIKMLSLRDHLFGNAKAAALVLLAAAGFLLLIASANVSNLLLARMMQRDKELAIRTVLGGSRARLILQLLTESALLAAVACAAGITLAFWIRRPLLALSPYHGSAFEHLPFDGRVFGFAVALGLVTTFLFGLIPAFRATGIRLAEAIKVGETAVIGGRGSLRLLSMVAAVEISTILILSTGAGLMLQSFWKIRYSHLGFQPDHLVAATLTLAGPHYRENNQQLAFIRQLLERARNLPGVESAGITSASDIPPGAWHATNTFAIEGRSLPLGGSRPIARYPTVSPGYFGIMGIPLLQGRLLQDSDGQHAARGVVVNHSLAQRYFYGEDPIGRRIRTGGDDQPWRTIAGVVGDVKTSGLTASPEPAIYFPYLQTDGLAEIGLVMRSPLDAGMIAGELRKAVAGLDPNQPVASVQAMADRLSESVSRPRFTAVPLCAFAAVAIMLGMIGVYGVMACRVRWQLREVAVRQALGAQRSDVVWHVLRQGIAIILPGACLGLLGSAALNRLLSGMLYDVPADDPLTLAAVAAGLIGVALLACCVPAVRADARIPSRHCVTTK